MKKQLIELMSKLPSKIDAAIITSDENRRYFTDMKSSAGTLVITRKNAYFIIDFRYFEKAKEVITDFEVILQDKPFEQIDMILRQNNVKNVGVEADCMTLSEMCRYKERLSGYEFSQGSELSDIINLLRSVKSDDEMAYIQKAQDITDEAFSYILGYIKPGMTELEVQLELEYQMRKRSGGYIAFESIVVSGVNSSLPHGVATEKKIEQGDFLTMDFGAAYNGYCSDMTRTIAIGKISDEQKKVYDIVLEAQLMAIEAVAEGKICREIDSVARSYIYKNGYEGCFGHGLGHSLGLNIHEDPRFGTTCETILMQNVVMTVEPGIYLEGKFGVRIEDMVAVTKNGLRNFTKSEKKLITL